MPCDRGRLVDMPGTPTGILVRCSVCPAEHHVDSNSPATAIASAEQAGWKVEERDMLASTARHRCPEHWRRWRDEDEDEEGECSDPGCLCRCHDDG